MKKRTRVIAWIYLAVTGYAIWAGVIMFLGLAHGYSVLPWYMVARMLLPVVECPLWLLLLRQRVWVWLPLVVIYSFLSAEWLYIVVRWYMYWRPHPSPLLELTGLYTLVIVILPLWALLTDRPGAWNRNYSEGDLQSND